MRSSTHRLRCSQCPHFVTLEMGGLTFYDQAKRYLEAIAEKEGWKLSPALCPQHVAPQTEEAV
jgi:hypothetical protein